MSAQQTHRKSFFSTTAGIITGIAGVLTAIVGIIGAATQLGWMRSRSDTPATATTVAPTTTALNPGLGGLLPTPTTGATGSAPGPTSANAVFEVTPAQVDFDRLGTRETIVRVENRGRNTIPFHPPSTSGLNARNFTATPVDASCTRLDPGRSCQIKVTFAPSGGGSYSAVLVIRPQQEVPAREVALKGSALL